MGRRADPEGFDEFVAAREPTLRRALVAALGPNLAADALAEAMAYAWEHWERVRVMDNPTGYLFRVGQSRSRRRRAGFLTRAEPVDPWIEPGLPAALAELTDQQRVAVTLIHGFGLTYREVGDLLEVSASTVQNHLERGLDKLRRLLEVNSDA